MQSGITRRLMLGGMLAPTVLGTIRSARAQQSNAVRIGVIQTLSGPVSQLGKAILLGVQAAAKELNESGGVDGRPVELVVRDTRYSANEDVAALYELAGAGINLVVGELYQIPTLAVLPLLPKLDLVYVSPGNVAMNNTHELFVRNYFRCSPNNRMLSSGLAEAAVKAAPDVTRWGVVFPDQVGYRQATDFFFDALKRIYAKNGRSAVEFSDPAVTKIGMTDFRDVITKIVSQKNDGILVDLVGNEATTFVQQAHAFGLFKSLKVVADVALGITAGPALKRDLPSNFLSNDIWYYPNYASVPAAQRFAAAVGGQVKPDEIDPYSAMGHTALMSLGAAARSAKGTKSGDVIGALESITFDSVFGPLRYRKEDHQLLVKSGCIHLEPQQADPGYRVADFVVVPVEDVVEAPSPGVPFIDK